MEPQESELITTLLTRLQGAVGQPKDAEADQMIRQAMTQMPDAPYYLVQTVLIQDLSLHNAQNRMAELEKQLADATAAKSSGSFLGGLLGRSQPAQPPPAASVPPSGPWTRAPQAQPGYPQPGYAQQPAYPPPGYAQPGYAPAGGMFGGSGNSFLRSAATTAAGVAGGALLFQGISSLFGHGYASGLGGFGGIGGFGGMGMPGGLSETVVNNYYGDGQGGGQGGGDSGSLSSDAGYAGGNTGGNDYGGGDAGYGGGDTGGNDYGGGDSGGGGDVGGGDFGGGDSGGGSSSC
jgi:hypothetical protein